MRARARAKHFILLVLRVESLRVEQSVKKPIVFTLKTRLLWSFYHKMWVNGPKMLATSYVLLYLCICSCTKSPVAALGTTQHTLHRKDFNYISINKYS